jgi:long-chain acyl-CoA synthetase
MSANAHARRPERDDTLAGLLSRLDEHGERPAMVAGTGRDTRTWSFARLATLAERLAAGLSEKAGVRAGDRVLLVGPASPAWIVCTLGLVRAGAVPVPVDLQTGDDNLAHLLEDSGARHVFVQHRFAERVERLGGRDLGTWLLDAKDGDPRDWQRLLSDGQIPEVGVTPAREAVLFYTSGTTGRPKGVPLSHGNLAYQLRVIDALGILQHDDRVLLPLPLHHVYPFVVGLLAPLSQGVPLLLPRSLTGPQVRRTLKEHSASVIVGIPRLYEALVDAVERQVRAEGRLATAWLRTSLAIGQWIQRLTGRQVGRRLLHPVHRQLGPSLRLLASGGAALSPDLQRRLEAFGWQVVIGYGLTETSPLLTVKRPGEGPAGCAGRAIPGTELQIAADSAGDAAGEDARDGDTDRPREPGVGELRVRGPGVFAGYLHLPDRTAEVLDDDGWFRTGDLARIDDDGFLRLAGRASTLIVTRGGENVQPEDVETVYAAHPLIAEVGVLQHEGELVALVVPDPQRAGDRPLDALREDVRAALDEAGRNLASYQRLDDFALTRSQLERTRLGKLRRHVLAERYADARAAPASDEQAPSPEEMLSAEDRNLLADPVAEAAWSLLRERFEDRRFTPDSSLRFDLGVDSLDWLDLALALREATGVELADDAIARVESVRDLLEELLQAEPAEADEASLFEHPESVLGEDDVERLRHPGPFTARIATSLYTLDRWLIRGLFRLRVQGAEHLPDEPGFVLAPNHVSYLDPLAVAAALDPACLRETYWAGWTGAVFDTRLKRAVARATRVLPIDPAAGPRRNLAFAAAALQQERNLVWFPEGTRSADGSLQDFRHGIGLLLAHLRVPVVPVAIGGTHDALPVGRRWPRFDRISVRFGEPLAPDELAQYTGDGAPEQIVDALHRRLARLLDDAGAAKPVRN